MIYIRFVILFFSSVIYASVNSPSNLSLKATSNSTVLISWQDNSDNETGFKIYRDGNFIAQTPANVTSYEDSGLYSKTTYRYTVKSTDNIGDDKRAVLISPLNSYYKHKPTLKWKMIDEHTTYSIVVRPLKENGIDPDWNRMDYSINNLTEAEANCNVQTRICSVTPNIDITGNHVWWVKTGDQEDWSERGYFSVNGYDREFTLDDGLLGIGKGYGVIGNYNVIKEDSENFYGDPDNDKNVTGLITIYRPDIARSKRPLIFFISGWGRTAASYDKYLRFLASHGYFVAHIYNQFPYHAEWGYNNMLNMLKYVVNEQTEWVDTTKVALIGHSYGAGAAVWLGKKVFSPPHNWGNQGRFLLLSAPWFSNVITKDELQDYPKNTKLMVQFSNDEQGRNGYPRLTDPRIIRAMYELINIPEYDKDFIVVKSDKTKSYTYNNKNYTYDATHRISYTGHTNSSGVYMPYDMLDVLLLNRLSHAMLNLVFEGDSYARVVALGNGSIEQKTMKTPQFSIKDLYVTDRYITEIDRPESEYIYQCSQGWEQDSWKLKDYCEDSNRNGIIDALE